MHRSGQSLVAHGATRAGGERLDLNQERMDENEKGGTFRRNWAKIPFQDGAGRRIHRGIGASQGVDGWQGIDERL